MSVLGELRAVLFLKVLASPLWCPAYEVLELNHGGSNG